MTVKNSKICLLFAGGTAISDKDIKGSSVNGKKDINGWLELVPEISLMASIEPVFVCADKDMSGIELWQNLATEIYNRLNEAVGFVILTNLDSVLYSGVALSLALKNINKPVILTSSQITESNVKLPDWSQKKVKAYGGLGVKANLINAVQLATMNLPAVALMFGNRIIRAVKAKRTGFLGLNIFSSVDDSYLGRIDFGISLLEKYKPSTDEVFLKNKFESSVSVTDYFPGADFLNILDIKTKGKVVRQLSDLKLLSNYKDSCPLVIYNRFLSEVSENQNILTINNMTWETCLVKFLWSLGQSNKIDEIRGFMFNEQCNEFIR